jgi:hypothetical protein
MSMGRRLFMTGIVLSAVLLGVPDRQLGAADAGSIVPLPAAVRAQLDKYLGAGVVGDPVPSGPLMAIDAYLPPKGTVMTYRVLEQGEKVRAETHKVEETTDPKFKPGWRMWLILWARSTSSRRATAALSSPPRRIATTRCCRASRPANP